MDALAGILPNWSPSGTAICTTFNAEGWGPLDNLVRVCPDGAGGAYVAWTDARNTPPLGTLVYDVFAQHLRADGTPDPAWPPEGLGLTGGSGYKYPHALIADEAGGFWLVSENPLVTSRLAITHHAPDGSVIGDWSTPSDASRPDAVSDGAGGVLVTWRDCRVCFIGTDGIYAMRLGPGAEPNAGWPADGVQVAASPDDDLELVSWSNSLGSVP